MNHLDPIRRASLELAVLASLVAAARGQEVISRLSVNDAWRPANADCQVFFTPEQNELSTSADGRWVVFESAANDLAPNLVGQLPRVYLADTVAQKIRCVAPLADSSSYDPSISADGRFIVFVSFADNLVSGDTNGTDDVFLVDRDPDGNGVFDEQPWTFEMISVTSTGALTDGDCLHPSVSDDGNRVLFLSNADNMVAHDTNADYDVFLRDRAAGTTILIDRSTKGVPPSKGCSGCDLSGDGTIAVFCSPAANIVSGDTNGAWDVFRVDVSKISAQRISKGINGTQSDGDSFVIRHCLSRDGTKVVFQSVADNLVASDTNGVSDVFQYDQSTGTITRVSVDSNGAQSDGASRYATSDADGGRVAFVSDADNLCASDGNHATDAFMHDDASGATTAISLSAQGATADCASATVTICGDGSKLAFSSCADDLVTAFYTGGFRNVFLDDVNGGTVSCVTVLPPGETNGASEADNYGLFENVAISADGRWIAFDSQATNLANYDGNGVSDVFVADRTTGKVVRISVAYDGALPNGRCENPSISADGRYIVFDSQATNLVAGGADGNGATDDLYLVDRDSDEDGIFDNPDTIMLISVDSNGVQGNGPCYYPAISADGKRVAFESSSTNWGSSSGLMQIYSKDLSNSALQLCSDPGNAFDSFNPSISGDGSTVLYTTWQNTTTFDSYLYVCSTRGPWPNQPAFLGSGYSYRNALSYDASRFVFGDISPDLETQITVGQIEWDDLGIMTSTPITNAGGLGPPSINRDGTVIAFASGDGMIPGDSNGQVDLFLATVDDDPYGNPQSISTPLLLDVTTTGSWPATGGSFAPAMSADALTCAFAGDSSDLVTNDTNGCRDVFLADLDHVASTRLYGTGYPDLGNVIPRLTMSPAPVLGTSTTLSLDNASGVATSALLVAGIAKADVTLKYGATILVDLTSSRNFIVSVPATGLALPTTIPSDPAFDGLSAYLQAIELDINSSHRFAFSRGLEVHFGH